MPCMLASDGSAAGITTDITSSTGTALVGSAPGFQVLCDSGCPGARFCRPKAGKNLRRDHRYRTKPKKAGAGPISAIPVVEAQLYLRPFLFCSCPPLPRGVPREGPNCRFPSDAGVWGRIRDRGNYDFNHNFDFKYSWVVEVISKGRHRHSNHQN